MKKFILLLSCLWITIASIANNVVISDIELGGSPGNYRVAFELSWENSWRVSTGQNNYDGVWVFFKYRVAGGDWQHLNMTGVGNSSGNEIDFSIFQNTGATKTGAIIHRITDITGNTGVLDIFLGVSDPVGFDIDIRGFAVEMVFIPQCSNCIIGDGNGTNESVNAFHEFDNNSNEIDGDGGDFSVDVNAFDDATLEAGFFIGPTHINAVGAGDDFITGQALWSMKYELSQGAYRDFLNSLILPQQTTRTANTPTSAVGTGALTTSGTSRNFIEIATSSTGGAPAVYGLDASGNNIFDETADGEWIACNFLSWMDLAAYLDWAGLSPMTEIGFERICRGASTAGANPSVLGEYAWGTTSIFATPYTMSGLNTAAENTSNSSITLGNASYSLSDIGGAFRNGIFATATSNRITSGASFYGVMDMSGNVSEPCVTVGNLAGRKFTSLNGDGVIGSNGNGNGIGNDPSTWPCDANTAGGVACSEIIGAAGTILRGGNFTTTSTLLKVSDRSAGQASSTRVNSQGGRGVLYIH